MNDNTYKCIREGMIELLKEKEYSEIQMKEIAERAHIGRRTLYRYFDNKDLILEYIAESLMDRFAEEIEKQEMMTLQTVTKAFYVFIDDNRPEFMLLKKARLLNYMEDRFPELITHVAAKTKYKDRNREKLKNIVQEMSIEDRYGFYYTIAGYWRMAMVWMEEEQPLSPEQMTEITIKIMNGGR